MVEIKAHESADAQAIAKLSWQVISDLMDAILESETRQAPCNYTSADEVAKADDLLKVIDHEMTVSEYRKVWGV